MDELISNSHKSKEVQKQQEKKIEKVIEGNAKVRKKSGVNKFLDNFVQEDGGRVKDYAMEVLISACLNAFSDIVGYGIDIFLYGESRGKKRDSSGSRISYRSYYEEKRNDNRRERESSSSRFDFDDVEVDTKGEAEEIISQMDDLIDIYGQASVSELYDLAGLCAPYTADRYGWTNFAGATSVRTREGTYIIKTPKITLLQTN